MTSIQFSHQGYRARNTASSLLLSIFFLSLLVTLALGVSSLVLRDVRTVRTTVAGVQARYAAEGMNELGLSILKNNLPGFEPELTDYEFENGVLASLDIDARSAAVPCLGGWRRLSYQESVQLPLFAQVDHTGLVENIEDFQVSYYLGDYEGGAVPVNSLLSDVLRWRITGLREDNDNTEAISEFIPLRSPNSRELPGQFGTRLDEAINDAFSQAKYVNSLTKVFHETYPISQFMSSHRLSYLTLTHAAPQFEDFYL